MANQPHPSKKAVTWRLQRDLIERVQYAAASRYETVLAFVTRALEHELAAIHHQPDKDTP
jgi:predicted transcriptional regulator